MLPNLQLEQTDRLAAQSVLRPPCAEAGRQLNCTLARLGRDRTAARAPKIPLAFRNGRR
jgi:hypothetical protein